MGDELNILWQDYWEKRNEIHHLRLMDAYTPMLQNIAEEIKADNSIEVPKDFLFVACVFVLKAYILVYPRDCHISFEEFSRKALKQLMLEEVGNYLNEVPTGY